MSESNERPYVVVTTSAAAGRGVFGGYLKSRNGDEVILVDGRNCVYWCKDVRGFLGLANTGPLKGSKVGPAVPILRLVGVTCIAHCTANARMAWESEPWN